MRVLWKQFFSYRQVEQHMLVSDRMGPQADIPPSIDLPCFCLAVEQRLTFGICAQEVKIEFSTPMLELS